MRLLAISIGLLASSTVFCSGCGGSKKEAAAPETNPWADYKGTYAGPTTAKSDPAPSTKSSASSTSTASGDGAKTMSSSAALKTDTPAPETAKPAKKGPKKATKKKKAGAATDTN